MQLPKRKAPRSAARARISHGKQAAPCVVGIGASAGGFEPIRNLINAMPPDSGLAFVVIQHLAPTHKSFAVDLLGKHTTMQVVEAKDGMRIEPNCIYTAPSDQFLSLEKGVLRLALVHEARGLRLPIDHFFNTLGADQHEKAIGIILSGTGADGAVGAKTIAANGGIVLAQAPETAQFDGMPRSAIATGVVNQVLAVEAMPKALIAYARHSYATGAEVPEVPGTNETRALAGVLAVIRTRHGFDFAGYKQGTLLRRIRRRMGLSSIDEIADYCALLKRKPAELDALYRDLFIGVTEFFRDPQAWEALQAEVIKPLLAGHAGDDPVRAWVPGCASGEEAYTLAMLLLAGLKDAGRSCQLQVFATDANEEALQFARAGVYPAGIAAHVPPALLRRCFVDRPPGHYQVTPELREAVTFSRQNVFADPPFSKLELISCRNLLIYLEPGVQDKILALFRFALRERGYLFLGGAETIGKHGKLFRPIAKKWRIFQSCGPAPRAAPVLPVMAGERRAGVADVLPPVPSHPVARGVQASSVAQRLVLDRFAPAAVLVNSNFEALYYCGPTEKFLVRPRGVPTLDLLLLAREGLRSRLRGAVRKALSAHKSVAINDARVKRGNDFVPVRITVVPAPDAEGLGRLCLVVFEDRPPRLKTGTAKGRESARVRMLEEELRATKDDLQHSIEDLETSNKELTVTHQDFMSSNEELQSINEELESSKEELQSLNEELNTVNQQLQNKVAELEAANNDLNNLIASSGIATLYLDRELRIRWFTPAMGSEFHVMAADAGRPVSDLGSPLTDAGLLADAAAALQKLTPVEHEQTVKDGRCYLRRIVPYRTADSRVDGVVVTFADITESKRTAMSALEAKQHLAATLEQQVRERTSQLRDLAFALATAEEQERRNLAQNLHDDLAQVLSVTQIKLKALGKDQVADGAKVLLRESNALLEQASRTVHSLAFQLSPSVLYELGLMPAIDWLAEEMQRLYGLHVAIHDDGERKPIAEQVKITLYRAVRELLINVARHAKVNTAEVNGRRQENRLVIEVRDGGAGFDTQAVTAQAGKGGFGLVSVRERIEMIGGDVKLDSLPGDGTTVTLSVPLLQDPEEAGAST